MIAPILLALSIGQPNIILIRSDDQALDSFAPTAIVPSTGQPVMRHTLQFIAQQGTTFSNSFASLPLCSPSRATLLTGQYAHNHGVLTNNAPLGGYDALDHTNTLPVWLTSAGYYTMHLGKYINGYSGVGIPPGWSEWYTSTSQTYFNYNLNENGASVHYGSSASAYHTDVMRDKALAFIQGQHDAPYFLQVDFIGPHDNGPAPGFVTPAPRHVGLMASYQPPSLIAPSFNEQDVGDKPAAIQALPLLTGTDVAEITTRARERMESLLSVDEAVRDIVAALESTGQLANTYVIFTSDNGFQQGEHRIRQGKNEVYDESIRVPLMIRGPGIPAGAVRRGFVANVDLPATILEWSGAVPGLAQDGMSLVPLLQSGSAPWREHVLIERFTNALGNVPAHFAALRSNSYLYAEHDLTMDGTIEARELYQFTPQVCGAPPDPFEMQSLHGNACYAAQVRAMHLDLVKLKDCVGAGCQ